MYKHQYRQLQHEAQCDLRPDSDFNRLVNRRKRLLPHESDNEDDVPLSPENQDRVEFSQSPPGSPLPQLEASSTPVHIPQSLPSLEQNIPHPNYPQNTPQPEPSIPQLQPIHHDRDQPHYVDSVDLNMPSTTSNYTNEYPHELYSSMESEKSPNRTTDTVQLETNEHSLAKSDRTADESTTDENSELVNDTRETADTTRESEVSEDQPESPQIIKQTQEDMLQRAELVQDGNRRFVKLYNHDGSYKVYKIEDKTS